MKNYLSIKKKLKKTKSADVYRNVRKLVKTLYSRTLSDEVFLNKHFNEVFEREMNMDNPQTFNEKLQWLKLNWYDPKAEICADKFAVRGYLESVGLGNILNELIAVYDNVNDINIDELPEKFVLKCTHGSGCNIICKDKKNLDWGVAKKDLKKWMRTNYFWPSREWVYKNIKPRIICEKFIEDDTFGELIDYKIFCFNGIPEFIQVDFDRFTNHKRNFYDTKWNKLPFVMEYDNFDIALSPKQLKEMLHYASILSEPFVHVRVDFYEIDNEVFFGELTFFHGGGFLIFEPEKYDYEYGLKLILPK